MLLVWLLLSVAIAALTVMALRFCAHLLFDQSNTIDKWSD